MEIRGTRYRPLAAVSNPPNPFRGAHLEWEGPPPQVELQVFEDLSRSVLSKNDSPDLPFTWSINPYRGCMHACAYCYARPSHHYLDFGAGTDFDRKIVIKRDAPALLRAAFEKRSWRGEAIVFSGNTDCYQPLEASLGITRACLEVCLEYRNPVSLITKSALVERDAALLAQLAKEARCFVTMSIPFFDAERCRRIEPFAPTPARRFRALRVLSEAGVPVGVNVAPIIPGLNDEDIPRILEAAAEAGASRAGHILVRLPGEVNAIFEERLRAAFPMRAERVLSLIEQTRSGKRNDAGFDRRMRGQGEYWQAIESLFMTTARRVGLATSGPGVDAGVGSERPSTFQRPRTGAEQLSLWD